jgi:GT2 family glycosyltransferase
MLFLNNDIIFSNAYENLKMMIDFNGDKDIGITGAYLFYPDKSVQHMGVDFFKTGEAKGLCYHPNHREFINKPDIGFNSTIPATTGACLMIKSKLFYDADGFDEEYHEECQDVALCLTVRRFGYRTSIVYSGDIIHMENATRPKNSENWEDRRRFLRKWKSFIEVI